MENNDDNDIQITNVGEHLPGNISTCRVCKPRIFDWKKL